MTIEQRAVAQYGLTNDPTLGVWMLRDGTLMNGSIEGRQRDIDHRCISEFFKTSKFEDPGSASIYMLKFMRRGNIRWGCNEFGFNADVIKTPSLEQYKAVDRYMNMALDAGIETQVRVLKTLYTGRSYSFLEYQEHLFRYHPEYMN